MNKNCLSYWFPKLQSAGVPVPRTELVVEDEIRFSMFLDGKTPPGYGSFEMKLLDAILKVGYGPTWFLRTGQGSGKHNWKNTCFLNGLSELKQHVANLVEWSELVDFRGLPYDVWCVREMLPVDPVATLPIYGDMPLVKEVRAFIRDGQVICSHPYWPRRAIGEGFDNVNELLIDDLYVGTSSLMPDEVADTIQLIESVADAFAGDGSWSVDILKTRRGWYVTDMAIASRSFHWEDCEIKSQFTERE